MNKIKKKLKKIRIHHEGTHILLIAALLLAAANGLLYWGLAWKIPFYIVLLASIILYGLMVNFFRCPIRIFKGDTEKVVVAPADGRIVVIEEVEEHEYFHDKRLMISIFMGITNVHANWYPRGRSGETSDPPQRTLHESMAAEGQHRKRTLYRHYRNPGRTNRNGAADSGSGGKKNRHLRRAGR